MSHTPGLPWGWDTGAGGGGRLGDRRGTGQRGHRAPSRSEQRKACPSRSLAIGQWDGLSAGKARLQCGGSRGSWVGSRQEAHGRAAMARLEQTSGPASHASPMEQHGEPRSPLPHISTIPKEPPMGVDQQAKAGMSKSKKKLKKKKRRG